MSLDIASIRADFPALHQQVHDHPLVYLDNAATTQKPACVIDAVRRYYEEDNANVHRGVHALSERATAQYEGVREKLRAFINAASTREIVFVRGATEAINLVAHSFGRPRLTAGDEILVTAMEHHSNIVPWQILCEQTGARLRVVPMNEAGELQPDALESLLGTRTKLLAVGHISNALGTINPVREMIGQAHAHDVPVLVDGAQATVHTPVDVQALDADFYAISGHKMFGPTGIGALYARESLLADMPPYQGGGDMISMVSFEKTRYNDLPWRFEAGTPHIAGVIGLGAAIDYLNGLGLEQVAAWEHALLEYATARARDFPGLRLIGTARDKAGILSFVLEDIHPHDIGTILDRQGVAVRTGHHCAMPVMDYFGVPATVRASMAVYNTREDIDRLFAALGKVRGMFA